MKTRFFAVVLMVAVVGFSACGGGKEKSDNNKIETFKVSNTTYTVSSSEITHLYSKTPPTGTQTEGTWSDLPKAKITAIITLEDSKAKVVDGTDELDFTGLVDSGTVGTVKVKAENGDVKSYLVKVTKGALGQ